MNKYILYTISFALILIIWYSLSAASFLYESVANPIDVFKLLFSKEAVEIFLRLYKTLQTVFISLIISIILGYSIGISLSFSPIVKGVLYPILNSLKSVPVTILLPVYITVFHLDIFVIPMICTPITASIAVNISQACVTINKNRKDIISSMHIGRFNYVIHILFFETLETLFSTLRVMLTLALTLEVAFDYFLSMNKGIGDYIRSYYESYASNKTTYIYAGILVISLCGILLVKALDLLTDKFMQWKVKI